jgi:membrane protease subunit HflC
MRKTILIVAVLVIVIVAAGNSFVTVDPTAYVYVTQFGRHEATYDGGDNEAGAGLHGKLPWPVQSVQRLDRRLHVFDLTGIELLTRDRDKNTVDKTLTIDAYVCWRIAGKDRISGEDRVDLFIRTVGTPDRAKSILGQQISSQLSAEVSKLKLSMDDLVSERPGAVTQTMRELERRLEGQKDKALKEYGINVEDIRIRRFNYPPQVQGTIVERIKSERQAKAAEYTRQGITQAAEIESAAKKMERVILADARAKADRLKGDAIAEADRIRNEAHRKEREFYKFLKKLEDYARILGDGKTVLYLSTQREMFDVLLNSNSNGSAGKQGSNNTAVKKTGN